LASAIEEGFADGNVSLALLEAYLGDGHFADVDAFILGCTHYPLIADSIQSFLSPSTQLLDTPAIVAKAVAAAIHDGRQVVGGEPERQFFVSDLTAAFAAGAKRFFGEDVALSARPIWRDQERNPSA
jgi:glutamate racemase